MAIRILSTHLVNKIAAGEVVERPASVVKELIENALDAGATRIDVMIEDGGRKLISVADNGGGMSAEDLALAFAPHATSKLAYEEDLFAISTLGFRGEALASIASISHAHIRTRQRANDGGFEAKASGETAEDVRPCPASPGTTVTVRDLFFNTPARRKFMRTVNTEMGHITEQLTRLSLPHPNVAFTLTNNGRQTQNLPSAETTAQRVRDLFSVDLAEALLPLSPRGHDVRVAGLIGTPSAARGSGKWQYVFLNGRYVRDRLLSHALREAYRGLLEPRQFPVAFVFLEIDPGEVDVNVHPTKIEVRFRNGQLVHGELLAAMKETLNKADLSPRVSFAESNDMGEPAGDDEQRRQSLREAMADFFKKAPPTQPRFSFPEGQSPAPHSANASAPAFAGQYTPQPQPQLASAPAMGRTVTPAPPLPRPAPAQSPAAIQIHNAYLIAAAEDGLVIIDQHALHERILYNEFRARLAGDAGRLTAQRMLIPETVDVTPAEMATLDNHSHLLERLGVEVAPFGPNSMAVQQFPSLLAERGVEAGPFLREMLDKLAEDETTDPERLMEDLLEMMACKAAVKAGDPLTQAEIDSLLRQSESVDKASSCPHGRPTTLKLTLKDLAKQFKRI